MKHQIINNDNTQHIQCRVFHQYGCRLFHGQVTLNFYVWKRRFADLLHIFVTKTWDKKLRKNQWKNRSMSTPIPGRRDNFSANRKTIKQCWFPLYPVPIPCTHLCFRQLHDSHSSLWRIESVRKTSQLSKSFSLAKRTHISCFESSCLSTAVENDFTIIW